jgi:type IV pilus assembly protein PilQ
MTIFCGWHMNKLQKIIFFFVWLIFFGTTFASSNADKLYSFEFEQIKVRDLLGIIAKMGQKNIIVNDKINAETSIKLHNVTWREALNSVLQAQSLIKHETGQVIVITKLDDPLLDSPKNQRTGTFKIKYSDAEELAEMINKQKGIIFNGNLAADARTNSLVVEGSPNALEALEKLISKIDIPVKQILIEARIISADDRLNQELGLKFSTIDNNSSSGNETSMDLPLNNESFGHFNFVIAKLGSKRILDLELAALETEGHAKTIANPKLVTANHKLAQIESGAEIPYQEKAYGGATTIAFKKAVLGLQVTPEIINEDKITLKIRLSQDKISQLSVNGEPAIETREINTQVLVNNGSTIVLGGIYEQNLTENREKIPFLSAIPLFGKLFQNQRTESEKKELLIFVTPKIVE